MKIAFTSCMSFTVFAQQPVWDQIAAQRPDRLLLLGDTLHVAPVQFPRPEITVGFDSSRDDARATRRALFEMAARENILIGAVHLPFPGIGRLREKDGAFSYEPLPWQLF
jgi:glyoxylase-like metal-dependent hydrolase (beta-lactamase superfamily II)